MQDLRESEEEEAAMENLVCTFVCICVRVLPEITDWIQKHLMNDSVGHQ